MNPLQRTNSLLAVVNPSIQDYLELKKLIGELNRAYYIESKSVLDDELYDALFKHLIAWEDKLPLGKEELADSPSQKLTENLTNAFQKVRHDYPMLSLSNAFDDSDLKRFVEDLGAEQTDFVIEPKFDGVSIALHYENDVFVRAITRGNGETGEDVTNNVKTLRNLPLRLPLSRFGISRAEFRGEIYIRKDAFDQLNTSRLEEGLDPFQNSRNTASGSLRLKDAQTVRSRPLEVVLFQCVHCNGQDPAKKLDKYHSKQMELLYSIGLPTTHTYIKLSNSMESLRGVVGYWKNKREDFPVEIDGLVIKVNNTCLHSYIGSTGHHPKWATAFKFTAASVESTLEAVEFQVGRTGVLTPVAKIQPAPLHGVIVRNISLHNQDFIDRLNLHIGDTVLVVRAGDVIPYIKDSWSASKDRGKRVAFPQECPACNSSVVREEESSAWVCTNAHCQAKKLEQLQYFVSKAALDIDGFGREIMKLLYEKGFVSSRVDVFALYKRREELILLERLGPKSIDKLIAAIDMGRKQSLWRQIVSLGIPLVGPQTAKAIIRHFKIRALEEVALLTLDQLIEIHDVGEKVSRSIVDFTNDPISSQEIKELSTFFEYNNASSPQGVSSELLASKRVVVTGSFDFASRNEIKEFVELHGGIVSGSVSKNTSVVFIGEKAGSKADKAGALGIPMLGPQELLPWIQYNIIPSMLKNEDSE